MDLSTAAKDLRAVLGLLFAVRGGAPYDHQQVQHVPPVGADGHDDDGTSGAGLWWDVSDSDAVSGFDQLFPYRTLFSFVYAWTLSSLQCDL